MFFIKRHIFIQVDIPQCDIYLNKVLFVLGFYYNTVWTNTTVDKKRDMPTSSALNLSWCPTSKKNCNVFVFPKNGTEAITSCVDHFR